MMAHTYLIIGVVAGVVLYAAIVALIVAVERSIQQFEEFEVWANDVE